jgi:nucleoside-diphosphate-sugar epimerase
MKNSDQLVLVTGGTGFVGIHCIVQLLQQGYTVRTTIRSMKRKQEVLDMLHEAGIRRAGNKTSMNFKIEQPLID